MSSMIIILPRTLNVCSSGDGTKIHTVAAGSLSECAPLASVSMVKNTEKGKRVRLPILEMRKIALAHIFAQSLGIVRLDCGVIMRRIAAVLRSSTYQPFYCDT